MQLPVGHEEWLHPIPANLSNNAHYSSSHGVGVGDRSSRLW
jgi:hypothetical protein